MAMATKFFVVTHDADGTGRRYLTPLELAHCEIRRSEDLGLVHIAFGPDERRARVYDTSKYCARLFDTKLAETMRTAQAPPARINRPQPEMKEELL